MNDFVLDTSSPENAKKSLNDLLSYLVRWLYHHILSSDMMIGKMTSLNETVENPFAFTDKYKTGIDIIDSEHSRLFEIISATNELIHNQFIPDKYDEIIHLLGELKDYTQLHFHDEEELMKRINYPELSSQQKAHSIFIERLVEIDISDLDDIDDNQTGYLLDLIQFLLGWLSNHILVLDKKLGNICVRIIFWSNRNYYLHKAKLRLYIDLFAGFLQYFCWLYYFLNFTT